MAEEHFTDPTERTAAADPPSGPAESTETAALKSERDDFYDRLLRKTA